MVRNSHAHVLPPPHLQSISRRPSTLACSSLHPSTSFPPPWSTSLSVAGQSRALLPTYHSSRKSNAAHSYQCMQHFCLSKWRYSGQCLGFLTCAQMLMHVIVHRGQKHCKSLAPNVGSGRKIRCRTGNNPHTSIVFPGFFGPTHYKWAILSLWSLNV